MASHTERSTFASCVATTIGVPASEVPLARADVGTYLAQRGMGLVPVQDAAGFAWAGPWIALRPAADGSGPRAVVMFGVPSGPIWDPAGTTDEVLEGFVVAPLDVALWAPPQARAPGDGTVEAIVLAPAAATPVAHVEAAQAVAGRGLDGDRYGRGVGTFASGRPGSALTRVDAEVLDELARERGAPVDHRRNVVVRGTDLNALVGRRFRLGAVVCEGRRPCEPCAHLDRLNGGGVLRPLVHRGGLRADVVVGGELRVGDALLSQAP